MIRKFIILVCICFAGCCAVVAHLSMKVEEEGEQLVGEGQPLTCQDLLAEKPKVTTRIKLSEFAVGKYKADFDYDGDGKWDDVCLALFSSHKKKITYGYQAVLVNLKGITDEEQLDQLLATGELDTTYWPRRQELENAAHSSLAQSYKNLDFSRSVILHCGYPAENPVLGEASLELSKMAGGIALGIALLTLLSYLFKRRGPKNLSEMEFDAPVTNRAGLPVKQNAI